MIQIDMDRPRRCLDCPAAYMVRYGEYTGTDICNVMNYKGVSPAECTVNLNERPEWCPMKEQEAVEPIPPTDESDLWRCGYCHHQIFRCTYQMYCEMCGRAVKWNG